MKTPILLKHFYLNTTQGMHMLDYQNSQSNTTTALSSYLAQISSNLVQSPPKSYKKPTLKPETRVIYRTQQELDNLTKVRFNILQHPKTLRRTASSCLLKLIVGRWLKDKNKCVIHQARMMWEIADYGYYKRLSLRQIQRALTILKSNGCITYKKSNKKESVNKYQVTELGLELFYYVINNNESEIQYKALDLEVEEKMSYANSQKQEETAPESFGFEKNVVVNMDLRNKNYNNINNNTRERFSFSKIDFNAEPIDLDHPPIAFTQNNEQVNFESREPDEDGMVSTIKLGRIINKKITEKVTYLSESIRKDIRENFEFIEARIIMRALRAIDCVQFVQNRIVWAIKKIVEKHQQDETPIASFEALVINVCNKVIKNYEEEQLSTGIVDNLKEAE
jgi:hypothetical protein